MFNLQIFCSNYYHDYNIENSLLEVDSGKHKTALRNIYSTLFDDGDLNRIKEYFTDEFYSNSSLWDKILARVSFESNTFKVKDVLKDKKIKVKNIIECSEEIIENFCKFLQFSEAEVHFEDCNAFLIKELHSMYIGKLVYLSVNDEITIDFCKLKNNLIINKFNKVNIQFNNPKKACYSISVGDFSICDKLFDTIEISYKDIKFDICRELIWEKYQNISINANDDILELDLFKNRDQLMIENDDFMNKKLIEIKKSLESWIESQVSVEKKELLRGEFVNGNFQKLRKLRWAESLNETISPLLDNLNNTIGTINNGHKYDDMIFGIVFGIILVFIIFFFLIFIYNIINNNEQINESV